MRELSRRGHPIWLWLLALAPFAVLMARQWSIGCGMVCGDYAQYYLHADALLHGRSYSDIGYIYTQYNPWIGPPAQPPGFPLTLIPIFAVFGQNPTAIKLLLQVSALVFLACAGLRIARTDGRLAGATAVMLTGVALASMTAADSAISDLGFCALFWAFILIADRPGDWTKGRIAMLTLLGLAAMSYRTAGAALIPAIGLYAVTGQNRRRALVPFVIWSCLAAVVALRLPVLTSVLSHLELTPQSLLSNMSRTLVLALRMSMFEALLYPFPWRMANGVYHVLGLLVMAWGFVRILRREWRSMTAALFIAYVVMLVLVPVRETRYSWPILPVFAWAFYEGLVALWALLPRWDAGRAQRAAFASSTAIALASAVLVFQRPPRDSLLDHPEVHALFARVAALPRSPATRVVFTNPRVLTWKTGVPAMGTFETTTPNTMAELRRNHISHVVLGDLGAAPWLDRSMRRTVAD
ncbi:MAG TPA: glycosyltransferase family 39 protein [Gemmatimonadaceae bacterium]|nr:glycosyltransferase family 39 protein [Gemmatimonadaceae bacterium]